MPRTRLAVTLVLALLAGCGSDESDPEAFDTEIEEGAPLPDVGEAPQSMEQPSTASVTTEDIDRWRRGMAAELEAVGEAEAELERSSTSEDTLSAMMAANDMSTLSAGAAAAGVDEDRYRFIRRTFSSAVGYLSPLELEMDVSEMPAEMVEQFEQARMTSLEQMSGVLPADVVETLREQAAELRQQDVGLAAARLRVAQAVR